MVVAKGAPAAQYGARAAVPTRELQPAMRAPAACPPMLHACLTVVVVISRLPAYL